MRFDVFLKDAFMVYCLLRFGRRQKCANYKQVELWPRRPPLRNTAMVGLAFVVPVIALLNISVTNARPHARQCASTLAIAKVPLLRDTPGPYFMSHVE
jgi:hypothetical protein